MKPSKQLCQPTKVQWNQFSIIEISSVQMVTEMLHKEFLSRMTWENQNFIIFQQNCNFSFILFQFTISKNKMSRKHHFLQTNWIQIEYQRLLDNGLKCSLFFEDWYSTMQNVLSYYVVKYFRQTVYYVILLELSSIFWFYSKI